MKRRNFPNQNVAFLLRNREMNIPKPGVNYQRRFYTSVCPNFTFVDVKVGDLFLRSFSPNGRVLIAISDQQSAVEIYNFRGSDASSETLRTLCITDNRNTVRQELFSKFFKLKHTITLCHNNEQLNRECSLFTDDNRYLIVCAERVIHETDIPQMSSWYQNNESITLTPYTLPIDYWIYSIDILRGIVVDIRHFNCDRICLAHNQGICLYNQTLAVLSIQHQTIHLFHVDDNGMMIKRQSIGRYLYDNDEIQLANFHLQTNSQPLLNGMKQRFMTFLYHKAMQSCREQTSLYPIRNYYRYYDFYRWLRMWRMQLLDENHLLIRYASEDIISMRLDATSQTTFFVVYDIKDTKILQIYESTSNELLQLYEQHYDDFRGSSVDKFTATLSNSIEARKNHDRFKQAIVNLGPTELIKGILLQLPINAQSFNSSPYLDPELFSFDDKWISAYNRPRPCSNLPISFFGRKCGMSKYHMQVGPPGLQPQGSLVAFIFHPQEPFGISIHRASGVYTVNFHLHFDGRSI